jgi:zinc protease
MILRRRARLALVAAPARLLVFLLAVAAAAALLSAQTAPAPASAIGLQDVIPFDAAVHTTTLPNGLTYFVRQNARPAKRVSLRLAVKAGSLHEADDQQGLASWCRTSKRSARGSVRT